MTLDAVEQAVLKILGQGAFGWHEIEVRLGMIDLARRDYDVLAVLRALQARGLVEAVQQGDRRTWRLPGPVSGC